MIHAEVAAERYDGRIRPGQHLSVATQFKPGEHWREPQAFREEAWLRREYVSNGRSTGDIAKQFGVSDASILYWMARHGIPRRTVSQARAIKHWSSPGEANGMFGKRGAEVPSWKGGVTPERQAFHQSAEWKAAALTVWRRDNATCLKCQKQHQPNTTPFDVHHIVSFEFVALRTDPKNLVLLCKQCHRWVHSRANSERLFVLVDDESRVVA